jgi:hypothetical protein
MYCGKLQNVPYVELCPLYRLSTQQWAGQVPDRAGHPPESSAASADVFATRREI